MPPPKFDWSHEHDCLVCGTVIQCQEPKCLYGLMSSDPWFCEKHDHRWRALRQVRDHKGRWVKTMG
jgi:hypothetical protein